MPPSPIAYATFFRLGGDIRANVFCPGPVDSDWQRDLKQRPLEILAAQKRLLAGAARSWRLSSPVIVRKVQVARLRPPAVPRMVVVGDAAHTIDPSGGGGLTFSLLEVELLLGFYAPGWLQNDECGAEAITAFYDDPRRTGAVKRFFAHGEYIFALNHDHYLLGVSRRLRFALHHLLGSRRQVRHFRLTSENSPWEQPAPYLHEQDEPRKRSWRRQITRKGTKRQSM